MKRAYHKWFSPNLQRDMELLIYGHAGARVLFFPTRMARFYDYENWRVIQSVEHMISNGWIQVYCLDSVDSESFYNSWTHPAGKVARHLQFENYVLREVMPFSYKLNPTNYLMSVGCSMGAYHAMNIALRHPKWFSKIVALSGRFDIAMQVGYFGNLLDGFYNEDVYFHMPSHYMANMPEGEQLEQIRRLNITFTIGKEDPFLQNNREFSRKLKEKHVTHNFYEWNGLAHSARYWRQMLPLYV
ncbi:esterase [Neptunitalea chrysea]|uniref:Esterase n=1 Tax=Neptunitalea chrysea TaxID=1647581 RepID=A0A9W6B6G8_9FLAO|nr:alpha/beta hydrolase-fold protein [Neptunitalea chrysea]GLB51598.1 esterase [Neptunitalea chrysea]